MNEAKFVHPNPSSTDWSFRKIAAMLSAGWHILLAFVIGMLLLAILYLALSTPKYTTILKVVPIASQNPGVSGRLGGLASLAGVSLGLSGQDSDFGLFLDGLKSRETAAAVAGEHEIVSRMFPAEWNQTTKSWLPPPETILSRLKRSLLGPNESWRAPDASRVQEFITTNVKVVVSQDSSIVLVSMENADPEFARNLISRLAYHSDRLNRERALVRAADHVRFLETELARETLAVQRDSLTELLTQQLRTRMMASSNLPYSADIFSAASTVDRPTSPNRPLILIGALVFGHFLGILALFAREEWRNEKQQEEFGK
ncbi:hypothetical protein FJQ54_02000 [Sandaracinobacter neustonicus]|uniref:Polysaccharide chain length determinant N-terminal domain-containing protein n=1 Tax=Sandaracinobacter neustonicus TaxID=1715348 RepID=A0A501XSV5_9SPHN|nr:hypothetical protein [Sandaracinobacter neustonicus]TPE63656.1 hypothetical protein FJQ54_02000 [Sandaracinobacter neustonicus]